MIVINSSNLSVLNKLVLQDYIFSGFSFDYTGKSACFSLLSSNRSIRYTFFLKSVIAINMQNCNLWGPGNAVYSFSGALNAPTLKTLIERYNANPELYEQSVLSDQKKHICLCLQLNSGDELCIVCEQMTFLSEKTQ